MGTNVSVFVGVNSTDQKVLNEVIKYGIEIDPSKDLITWDKYCLGKWSSYSKYDPEDLIKNISKKFSNLIFAIHYRGELSGVFYIKDGISLNRDFIFPPRFPTDSEFNKASNKYKKELEKSKLKEEKESLENEVKKLKDALDKAQQKLSSICI